MFFSACAVEDGKAGERTDTQLGEEQCDCNIVAGNCERPMHRPMIGQEGPEGDLLSDYA